MRILIIGGSGAAGSRIAAEARRRDHEVAIASRTTGARLDASDVEAVTAAAAHMDVVVAATRPAIGCEAEVDAVTEALVAGSARAGARLLVVGGASPLRVPGTGWTALEDPHWVPPTIRPIAAASTRQLEVLQAAGRESAWTYLAPAADFAPAVLDEIEEPRMLRGVIAVGA